MFIQFRVIFVQVVLCCSLSLLSFSVGFAQNGEFSRSTLSGQAAHAIGRGDDLLPFPLNWGNVIRRVTHNVGLENPVTNETADFINLCLSVSYVPVEGACQITVPLLVDTAVVCYQVGDAVCGTVGDVACTTGNVIGDVAGWTSGAVADVGGILGSGADIACCFLGGLFGSDPEPDPGSFCHAEFAVAAASASICGNGLVEQGEECDGSGVGYCTAEFPRCSDKCECIAGDTTAFAGLER